MISMVLSILILTCTILFNVVGNILIIIIIINNKITTRTFIIKVKHVLVVKSYAGGV